MQNLETLERDLVEGNFRRVYVVLGPEEYQCRQAISLLKSSLTTPESLAFDYSEFVAGEIPIDQIIEAANTFPMLSKRRLVLIYQADHLEEEEQETLLDSIGALPSRSVLVLSAADLDHRKKFYKSLRDAACLIEFPKLNGAALERWAESYVKRHGYRVSSPAAKKIIDLAGSDLQSLAMELDKLFLYAGAEKTIPDSAVDDLVRGSREQSIWDLIDAVGRRDRSSALKSLANLIEMGEPPLRIVTMLARQFRQVLIAQEGMQEGIAAREIGTRAQIPPFKQQEFLRNARAINPASVRKMFMRLSEIDRQLKSTGADGRILLENLICSL